MSTVILQPSFLFFSIYLMALIHTWTLILAYYTMHVIGIPSLENTSELRGGPWCYSRGIGDYKAFELHPVCPLS